MKSAAILGGSNKGYECHHAMELPIWWGSDVPLASAPKMTMVFLKDNPTGTLSTGTLATLTWLKTKPQKLSAMYNHGLGDSKSRFVFV